ncbi:hypothetical protein [Paenibacillus sp. HB172176]|uniref:hypothetical protein n=1 Tax=Paenibacillus sp. HB172176 TaxID=2493690 RepID=UPI00143B1C1B|nr:hypothetical protein [Paenibacillus sp. HB172176]
MTAKLEDTKKRTQKLSTAAVQATAAYMLPFYRKAAKNEAFAKAWSAAVRKGNIDAMQKLLSTVLPQHIRLAELGSNGIGFFIGFTFPYDDYPYVNSTSIRPGETQNTFSDEMFRLISKDILRFYAALVSSKAFAEALVKAVNLGHTKRLKQYIKMFIPSCALKKIESDDSGFYLGFESAESKYTYYNQFFREKVL